MQSEIEYVNSWKNSKGRRLSRKNQFCSCHLLL